MSTLRFVNQRHWTAIESHLCEGSGERFAFAYTRCIRSGPDPILEVVGIELVPEDDTICDRSGWTINDHALDRVHNEASASGVGLVELHNHRHGPPGFSQIDEAGLESMARYVSAMLPAHPYGAGVYAQGRVHVEHWTREPDGLRRDRFRSVTVIGDEFRVLNPPESTATGRLIRQSDVLGPHGMGTLAGLRAAIVGVGGTGSQTALTLAYLGVNDLVLLDDDLVEESNLSRLVTAGYADIGAAKTLTARRRLREINPALRVHTGTAVTPHGDHQELADVDVIFGCVDNDGPRDLLNQIAVDFAVPYIDIATEILTETIPETIGGRIVCVTPGRGMPSLPGRTRPDRSRELGQDSGPAGSGSSTRLRDLRAQPGGRAPQRSRGECRGGRVRSLDLRNPCTSTIHRHRPRRQPQQRRSRTRDQSHAPPSRQGIAVLHRLCESHWVWWRLRCAPGFARSACLIPSGGCGVT